MPKDLTLPFDLEQIQKIIDKYPPPFIFMTKKE